MPQGTIPPVSGPPAAETRATSVWGSAVGGLLTWDAVDFGRRAARLRASEAAAAAADGDPADHDRLQRQVAAGEAYLTLLAAEARVRHGRGGRGAGAHAADRWSTRRWRRTCGRGRTPIGHAPSSGAPEDRSSRTRGSTKRARASPSRPWLDSAADDLACGHGPRAARPTPGCSNRPRRRPHPQVRRVGGSRRARPNHDVRDRRRRATCPSLSLVGSRVRAGLRRPGGRHAQRRQLTVCSPTSSTGESGVTVSHATARLQGRARADGRGGCRRRHSAQAREVRTWLAIWPFVRPEAAAEVDHAQASRDCCSTRSSRRSESPSSRC